MSTTELERLQNDFAARIRNPDGNAIPEGVDPSRMAVYENLIYNGTEELLENCFPVIYEIASDELRESLIRGFLSDHPAESPLFYEVPEEFLSYLIEGRDEPSDPPYLAELAHFEWMELALELTDEPRPENVNPKGDLYHDIIEPSPLMEVVGYHYPVHEIDAKNLPTAQDKGSYCLAVYRDRDDVVQCLVLSVIATRLLQFVRQHELTGKQAVEFLAQEMPDSSLDDLKETSMDVFQQLLEADVILGTQQ